ncbi:MAG: ABC-F family ATP-binding cassette domain-containing protein [Chlorobi bacterium]|nr:ABC-F family ATP-binding cassette domain-containing protein [Chlorobiota bacterium]
MEILKVEKLSKSYGNKTLFEDISFVVNEKEKIALVAANGSGKTSLLNIITGKDIPDSGKINIKPGLTVGYLEQEANFDDNLTLIEQVLNSGNGISDVVREYEKAVISGNRMLMQKAADEMDRVGAWNFEREIKTVLTKLNLTDFEKLTGQLSGGQKKRLALAVALLNKPDFLILDEPVNHLDFEMIEWLEGYISKSPLTLLTVTHDRRFLDNVSNVILELSDAKIYRYNGNYSYFLRKRKERIENMNAEAEKIRNLLKKEEKWMNRQPQARASKAKARTDRFYELKEKSAKNYNDKTFNIEIEGKRLGKKIADIYNISKSLGGKLLINDFSYKFSKGEKIGIFGSNGAGKTTFLNIIAGELPADSGRIEIGETVSAGYFKQKSIDADEDVRLIDYIRNIADVVKPGKNREMSAAQFAEYFLFPRKMHYNYISQLSGGEKKRLYLLSILMKNPNFLILDEPTNDLDIMTVGILEDYLLKFTGTVLFVSHDRSFTDNVAESLFIFEGNGKIRHFHGNYTDYVTYINNKKENKQSERLPEKKKKKSSGKSSVGKLSYKEKREMEMLEKELDILNNERLEIENYLQGGIYDEKELAEKSKRLPELTKIIDEKEMRWLELSEKK